MSIFVRLLTLYLVLCLAIPLASGQYACPTPPAVFGQQAFPLSTAFQSHNDYQTEWYFVVSNLCIVEGDNTFHGNNANNNYWRGGCQDPLGFHVTSLVFNTSGGHASSPTNALVSSTVIQLTFGETNYVFSQLGQPPVYPQQLFDMNYISLDRTGFFEYKLISGVGGQPESLYNFVAVTPNITVNLILRSMGPLMIHGNGGWSGIRVPAPNCIGVYDLSMLQLSTSGVVRYNNDAFFVSGMSLFDHEWATNTLKAVLPPSSWVWLGLRIGPASIWIYVGRNNRTLNFAGSAVEYLYPNGTMARGKATALNVLSTWTSPKTNINYPNHFTLFTTLPELAELLVTPLFQKQEAYYVSVDSKIDNYYEGDVSITVVNGDGCFGEKQGSGYLELEGFTPI